MSNLWYSSVTISSLSRHMSALCAANSMDSFHSLSALWSGDRLPGLRPHTHAKPFFYMQPQRRPV
ncbi:hypothetical protein [Paenibacillus sp. JNUCC31]|uniref:hypothetical protein n=1 Tax=Paenibacillus sp. JNUCC-31 TaxID=2777983 RepID=UPI001E3482A8|nr:hypothetical protein [Paenibacillus sp. JNUCC-31]